MVKTHASLNTWRDAVLYASESASFGDDPDQDAHEVMLAIGDAQRAGDGLALAAAYAKAFALVRTAQGSGQAWAAWHTGKVPMYFKYNWNTIEKWIKDNGMTFECDNQKRPLTLFRGGRLRGMSWTDNQTKAEYYARWRFKQGEKLILHKLDLVNADILAARSYNESWTDIQGNTKESHLTEFIISTKHCINAKEVDFIKGASLSDYVNHLKSGFDNKMKSNNVKHPSELALSFIING